MGTNKLQDAVDAYLKQTATTKQSLANHLGIKSVDTFDSKVHGSRELRLSEAYLLANVLGRSLEDGDAMVYHKASQM